MHNANIHLLTKYALLAQKIYCTNHFNDKLFSCMNMFIKVIVTVLRLKDIPSDNGDEEQVY